VSGTGGRHGADNLLTSPSHLFLPLRQAVQARAPRFGMWPGVVLEADGESSIGGCESGWFAAAALRLLEGTTGLGIVELVEDNDMEQRREVP
jgi:hypothetical protein